MSDKPEWWTADPHPAYGPCDGFAHGGCSECHRVIWEQAKMLEKCDAAWREVRQKVRDLKTPAPEAKDYELLLNVAARIRNGFEYDPGHSDLDNEQPIHLRATLREWRELNYALNKLRLEPQNGSTE